MDSSRGLSIWLGSLPQLEGDGLAFFSMPRLAGIDLFDPEPPCCGAAFLTTRPFTTGFNFRRDGASVHARRGIRWVVVKLREETSLGDLLAATQAEAQVGLDLLGRQGLFFELDAPDSNHLLWWPDANGPRLRAAHMTVFEAPKLTLQGKVIRADGSEAPPPPSAPWHPLLRFYRLAHLAEDPIERFRYLYLAIENAISSVSAYVPPEGEVVWLSRVLRTLSIDWVSVLEGTVPVAGDAVDHVVGVVYKQARLPAFHAKKGRDILLPADSSARSRAAKACKIALRLLKAIAESQGQTLGGSVVTAEGFSRMTAGLAANAKIQFSADARRHDPADTEFSRPECPVTELTPTTTPEEFAVLFRATLAAPTAAIARVGLVAEGSTMSATCYETILDTRGFAAIDFVLGLQMTQPGKTWTAQPPT